MNSELKMKNIIKLKNNLEKKLFTEGLTKNEKSLLSEIKNKLEEIDYEGPERMDPGIEKKITKKQTPFHKHPSMPEGDKDYIDIISSKRFKDSVDKVRRFLGDTRMLQSRNPVMALMQTVMGALQKTSMVEMRNKRYLENLAVDLVKKEMGIPEGALQFDAKLVHGPQSAAAGMKSEPEEYDENEIKQAFKKHPQELENFVDEFESFNMERAKRRFINSLIQGAAFKGGHMYVLVTDELNRLDPQLVNLYGVTQSLMEHLYWIMPDMEAMAGSGGGQLGQEEVDFNTEPPTVKARAGTFPLLIHELVKGVYEVFGAHGIPEDPRRAEMVIGSEDTLPAEIWDSRLGPIFWEKFLAAHPEDLFEDEKKHLQHYLFMRFSKLSAPEFLRIAKLILKEDPEGKRFLQRLVDEIVADLKRAEFEKNIGNEDDDEDIDDIDISGLFK